ncbi:MAG TPA: hypothetical protein VN577_09335 [Terriglobales bacterium]|nr:hypothetical protein [Terriglobales bacterium]
MSGPVPDRNIPAATVFRVASTMKRSAQARIWSHEGTSGFRAVIVVPFWFDAIYAHSYNYSAIPYPG